MKITFGWLLSVLLPGILSAAGLPTGKPSDVGLSAERLARVRQTLENHAAQNHIAGAVILIARQGKIAEFDAVGQMDLASRKPMQPDTMFRIASMTKPITSVAVMMLYEEGLLRLYDPISKYIPEFKNLKVAKPTFREGEADFTLVPAEGEITIRQLLSHTAGLANRSSGLMREQYRKLDDSRRPDETTGEFVKRLAKLPLDFEPGTAWEYGPATDVLGYLVEVVSGMKFDDFVRTRILEPLQMKDTYFFVPPEKLSRVAVLYHPDASGSGLEPFTPKRQSWTDGKTKFVSGAGGLVSTAADYFRFCQMLLNGGELDGRRILGRKTIELMTQNHIGKIRYESGFRFGLGFQIQTDIGEALLPGSPGTYNWAGAYNTLFWIDPKEQLIAILMLQLTPDDYLRIPEEFHIQVMSAIQ